MSKEKVTDTIISVVSATSSVATVITSVAAPTGFAALGVALGITSAPLIFTVAGIVGGVSKTAVAVMGVYKVVSELKK